MRWLLPLLLALPAYPQVHGSGLTDDDALDCVECGPDRLAAAWQTAVFVGVGVAWYWYDRDLNMRDWDDPEWEGRFTGEAIAFDNNEFTINNLWHPLDGGLYHLVGRFNRMSLWEAALLSTLTSGFWEFVLEWREKVSINDLVMTPGGGVPLGEVTWQLGDYLLSRPTDPAQADALGFSTRYAHRFSLGYELSMTRSLSVPEPAPIGSHGYLLRIEMARVKGYDHPHDVSRFFAEGNFTELTLRQHFADGAVGDVEVFAGLLLAGYYAQRFEPGLRGPAGRVGVGMAFEHYQRWLEPQDRFAAVHLPGLVGSGRLLDGTRGLSLSISVHPDFTAIESLAWPEVAAEEPDLAMRSVVLHQGYYYAFGLSSWVELTGWWRPIELGARARVGAWSSIDGEDRHQSEATGDRPLEDRLYTLSGWVAWAPQSAPMELRFLVEGVTRESRVEPARVERSLRRGLLSAALRF